MMKDKVLVGVSISGILSLLVFSLGANSSPHTATQWEYGVFLQGYQGFQWVQDGQHVTGDSASTFAQRMDLPRDFRVDTRAGTLQRATFDHLGRQGWELVQVVHNNDLPGSYHYAYWFKRPK
jgi:hypothetical protein